MTRSKEDLDSEDPIGLDGSSNMYAYLGENPLNPTPGRCTQQLVRVSQRLQGGGALPAAQRQNRVTRGLLASSSTETSSSSAS